MSGRDLPGETTWYCVRQNGFGGRSGWIDCRSPSGLRNRVGARPDEWVEACVAHGFQEVPAERFASVFMQRARGLVGMEIAYGGEVTRISPTKMLAGNLRFRRALERHLEETSVSVGDFFRAGRLRAFSGRQYLLPGVAGHGPVELFRGSTLISPTRSIDTGRASKLAGGIGRWMLRNQAADGSLPYKYWPSRGSQSPADNAIRRFLGSLALFRLAELRKSSALLEAATRNLRFNLDRYFRPTGEGCGVIVERAGAKLGAAAVAGLAILANPARGQFSEQLAMLSKAIESLADPTLGFRTFFFPRNRDGDNWNFYSGEALLFWAESIRQGLPSAPTKERCTAAFERCRARHRLKRNPAFVPWHAQACASLYAITGRQEFADFAFEISDWLLPMQQWDDALPPDLAGRFYNPRRPDFGPPHAASTGAYLEGLADAFALAQATGNHARATRYEQALARGLRSLRQLQFRDSRDAFYVFRKRRVLGALRTEVYDNAIRIDSAAHALLAAIKILQPPKFGISAGRVEIADCSAGIRTRSSTDRKRERCPDLGAEDGAADRGRHPRRRGQRSAGLGQRQRRAPRCGGR